MSVYVWGFGKLGQLGNGQTDTCHLPVSPNLPAKTVCVYVHSGGYYTALVTNDGRLFTFGCGKHGRLGTGNETDMLEPVEVVVSSPETKDVKVKFKQVSCGIWHGAGLTSENKVYTWGYGKACGNESQRFYTPQLLLGPFSTNVAGVSCGNNFTLLWTKNGEAYSYGCGRHGALGHGTTENVCTPTLISKFKESKCKITFMDAGFSHSGAISENGEVFMFGKATDGALGNGTTAHKEITSPKLVEHFRDNDIKIKELSCSVGDKHGHTLFVSEEGLTYSCGYGYKGKLGLGDQLPRLVPTAISADSFNGESIAHVSAGGIHSAAVSRQGHVFTWGCGSDGRLGHPDGKGHRYLFRSDVPRLVDALVKSGTAVGISCSYYHTVSLLS